MSTVHAKALTIQSDLLKGMCLGIEKMVSGNVPIICWSVLSTASCRREDQQEIASVLCKITST